MYALKNLDQLIEACRKGDPRAQRQLYEVLARKMMGVCLRYASNKEEAEDIMQEGFINMFKNLDKYSGTGSFEGWVRKIMVNASLLNYRKVKKLREQMDFDQVSYEVASDEDAYSALSTKELLGYIRKLPEGYRIVFNMFAIEGNSHKEIASSLGVTESTSKTQYLRARKFLQGIILKEQVA